MKKLRHNTIHLKSGFTRLVKHRVAALQRVVNSTHASDQRLYVYQIHSKVGYTTRCNTTGFTLVETLVAIAVLLVAIVGPMTIAAQGLQASFFSREQTTAVYLAQEAIESIEKARNDQALDEIYSGISPRIWQLCQNGVLPADPDDPIAVQNPGAGYTDPDICESNTWGWYGELTADDGPDCDASTNESIGCGYDGASDTFHMCTSDADCRLQVDEGYTSGRYYQYDNGSPSQFTRTITLSDESDDEVLVTVEVKWRASLFGGSDSRVVLQTRIFDQYE